MSHHETPPGRDYPDCSNFQIPSERIAVARQAPIRPGAGPGRIRRLFRRPGSADRSRLSRSSGSRFRHPGRSHLPRRTPSMVNAVRQQTAPHRGEPGRCRDRRLGDAQIDRRRPSRRACRSHRGRHMSRPEKGGTDVVIRSQRGDILTKYCKIFDGLHATGDLRASQGDALRPWDGRCRSAEDAGPRRGRRRSVPVLRALHRNESRAVGLSRDVGIDLARGGGASVA
jgi:hypothetical protein